MHDARGRETHVMSGVVMEFASMLPPFLKSPPI